MRALTPPRCLARLLADPELEVVEMAPTPEALHASLGPVSVAGIAGALVGA